MLCWWLSQQLLLQLLPCLQLLLQLKQLLPLLM